LGALDLCAQGPAGGRGTGETLIIFVIWLRNLPQMSDTSLRGTSAHAA
jgi:hypothetical protein